MTARGERPSRREISLDTDRLLLRPATMADLDDLLLLETEPAVVRWTRGGCAATRDEVAERIERPGDPPWVALEKSGRQFVGNFILTPSFEIGWSLLPDHWRKGLATEGARGLIRMAFTHMGAQRVWAVTMQVNHRSRRVMERCGMRFVRSCVADWHREHPDWHEATEGADLGDVEYELVREEWEATVTAR